MFCGNCGKEIKESSRFCPFCGCGVYGNANANTGKQAVNNIPLYAIIAGCVIVVVIIIAVSLGNGSGNRNPFNGTSWRGPIGDHITTFIFKENHVMLFTPTKTDEEISYPYSYRGNVATIVTGWEIIKATISGSTMKLTIGESADEFMLYKQ